MAAIACIDQEGPTVSPSRVARFLGVKPPAIYKHWQNGAALQRATALELWRQYLQDCQTMMAQAPNQSDQPDLLQLGQFVRRFAKTHPARYQVMMQTQLPPSDQEAALVLQQLLNFLRQALQAYDLSETQLIDVMRMINAATYGFIALEQAGLMTLERSADDSYNAMLQALIGAVERL